MRRWLFNLAAGLSLLMLLAVLVVWPMSYDRAFQAAVRVSQDRPGAQTRLQVYRLSLSHGRFHAVRLVELGRFVGRVERQRRLPGMRDARHGVGSARRPMINPNHCAETQADPRSIRFLCPRS